MKTITATPLRVGQFEAERYGHVCPQSGWTMPETLMGRNGLAGSAGHGNDSTSVVRVRDLARIVKAAAPPRGELC